MTKVVSSNRQLRYQSMLFVCLLISNHHKSKMIETSNIDFDLFSFLRPLKHHQFFGFSNRSAWTIELPLEIVWNELYSVIYDLTGFVFYRAQRSATAFESFFRLKITKLMARITNFDQLKFFPSTRRSSMLLRAFSTRKPFDLFQMTIEDSLL